MSSVEGGGGSELEMLCYVSTCMLYEGIKGREPTRVDDNTVFIRGKSEIPESRIAIEESSREREERSDVTDALREARDCEVVILDVRGDLVIWEGSWRVDVDVENWRCDWISVSMMARDLGTTSTFRFSVFFPQH